MNGTHLPALLLVCTLALLLTTTRTRGGVPATQPADQANWPKTFTVTVGDVRTRIESAKMWTLSGLEYQGAVMAVEDSAYGTVITIRGVGHLGTAHFLDVPGTPGEIEKEHVKSLKLFVDEKPVTSFQPTMTASGKSFRMERSSSIRALDLECSAEIRDGVLIETSRWHATQDIDLQMTYPLMYAWTPKNTVYLFGDDNGIQKRGVFAQRVEEKSDAGLEKNSRWMAVFNPETGKGSVCYLVKYPKEAGGWLQWTDGPGVYRKLRIMGFVEKVVPKDFRGTYQSAVGFFSASEGDWEKAALKRVDELKSYAKEQNR
jgi:hypothetical protein